MHDDLQDYIKNDIKCLKLPTYLTMAIRNVSYVGAVKDCTIDFALDFANDLICLRYRNYTKKDSI